MTENNAAVVTTETTVTPETNPTPSVNFDSFKSVAPKELVELFDKNGVKDFDTLNKSYTGLNSLIGKKGLMKPVEGAPEAEVKAYNEKLYEEIGVPKDGKYEYTIPEIVPPEAVSQEFLDKLSSKAAQNGVPAKAFQEIINEVYTAYGEMLNESKPSLEGLKTEWGKDADTNIKLAHNFYKNVMASDPNLDAASLKFGNDPDFIKGIYNLAKRMGEDKLDANNINNAMNPDDLRAEGKKLAAEASELHRKGDFKGAELKNKQAQEKYSQYTSLTNS
jgi:hypothetical protein